MISPRKNSRRTSGRSGFSARNDSSTSRGGKRTRNSSSRNSGSTFGTSKPSGASRPSDGARPSSNSSRPSFANGKKSSGNFDLKKATRSGSSRSANDRRNRTSKGPSSKNPTSKRFRPVSRLRQESGSVFAGSQEFAGRSQPSSENAELSSLFQGRRLQQVLAAAGYGSRRQCEELIETGRVEVDGKVVSELGVRVLPHTQKIRVDGEALPKMKPVYLVVNKPKGILCTNRDQQGRRRAIDLIPSGYGRLFPVGRLDQNSEGLLLMTNDGALAERLTHPRFEVPKKYRVQVAGLIEQEVVQALKKGVYIAEGLVQADDVVVKSRYKQSSILEIVLKEGKNREIRRMLARVGHKVLQLQRVSVGPIKLGKLLPGEFRRLTNFEIAQLYNVAQIRPDSN